MQETDPVLGSDSADGHVVDHPRAGLRRRSWVFDVVLTLAVAGISLGPVFERESSSPLPLRLTFLTALVLPLVARRVRPIPVFGWIICLTLLAALWDPRGLEAPAAATVALYTLVSTSSRRNSLVAAVIAEAVVVVGSVRTETTNHLSVFIPLTAVTAAALGLGLYTGTRRALLAELRQRAARLERERDQQGELAAAAERARIAREMHDLVAHHLTVMVALSDGAAAAAPADTARATDAMRAVSATGRQALSDTRRLLGVLRDPAGPQTDEAVRSPLPGLADLDPLLDGVRAAGLPVSYETRGSAGVLAPPVQATLYRLVQEALTNTLKHGGPGVRATVRIEYRENEVLLDVTDDGAGATAPVPVGVGRGLTGMRERVHAFGGDVRTGPRATGGWQVRARLRTSGDGR
jgi:signal transduction histidine kinase